MKTHEFDFCVIGAGSAGYVAATTARGLGKRVIFAESPQPLAGLCILRGCMPSKTLLRSAEIAHFVKTAPDLGIEPGPATVNMHRVIQRKRQIIDGFAAYRRQGIAEFPILRGAPRFVGRKMLEVGDDCIEASAFLIATGSAINVPDIAGLRETGFVTSDDVLEMTALPESVIVLGGGFVACELAQYLVRLGVQTVMLQRSKTILSSEDHEIGEELRDALAADGIKIFTGVTFVRAEAAARKKAVVARIDGKEHRFEADELFAALGRRPNFERLNIEAAGIRSDGRGLVVNEYLQTTNPDVYAAGDVIGSRELVHVAVYEGQLAARNAFSGKRSAADYSLQAARALFTDPQAAVAGLSEKDCIERKIPYETASYPFNDHGKAIATDLTRGFVKLVVSPEGRLLGVAIVGAEASDLIHEAIALLYFKATVDDVMLMPHLHPTLAEIITYPAEELCDRIEHRRYALVTP